MAKVGTSNPDRTISLKRLQCVVENKHTTVGRFLLKHYAIHGCGLDRFGPPAGATDFFLLKNIRIGFGAPTQALFQVCRGSFLVVKRSEC
jgi:hypothetical protein